MIVSATLPASKTPTRQKRDYFTKYGEQARKVLESLLGKYVDEGIEDMKVKPLSGFGSPVGMVGLFGGKVVYRWVVVELGREIYRAA